MESERGGGRLITLVHKHSPNLEHLEGSENESLALGEAPDRDAETSHCGSPADRWPSSCFADAPICALGTSDRDVEGGYAMPFWSGKESRVARVSSGLCVAETPYARGIQILGDAARVARQCTWYLC